MPAATTASFTALVRRWNLPQSRAWQMLTGIGKPAGPLTPDQVLRVVYLLSIDAGMRGITGVPVGAWMVTPNPTPLLSGASPIDYLTRRGTPGYAALARQVEAWASL